MKAQGSLEYLIIIAAVIGIAAIVIYSISGVLSSQTPAAAIGTCKQAAVNCKASKMTSPSDPCNACSGACANTTINPCSAPEAIKGVSKGAIGCCKKGLPEKIYSGSTGCGTVLHMVTGWNTLTIPSDWEQTTAMELILLYPEITIVSYMDSGGTYHSYIAEASIGFSFDICPAMDILIYSTSPFDISG